MTQMFSHHVYTGLQAHRDARAHGARVGLFGAIPLSEHFCSVYMETR